LNLILKVSTLTLLTLAFCSCSKNKSELRGTYSPSLDGRTYLIIMDNNGGHCGPILVDGKAWKHSIGQIGEVQPGAHTVACNTELTININPGVVYHFNYWGP